MLICHLNKFAIFHIRKTGGSNLQYLLMETLKKRFPAAGQRACVIKYKHIAPSAIKRANFAPKIQEEIEHYFKFAFVRNPFDRLVSLYHQKNAAVTGEIPFNDFAAMTADQFLGARHGAGRGSEATDRWRHLRHPGGEDIARRIVRTATPQYDDLFYTPQSGDGAPICAVDYVARFENYAAEYAFLCEKFNLTNNYDPNRENWVKTSTHEHYSHYYTDEAREWVAEAYADDLREFGYTFEMENKIKEKF